MFRYLDCGWRLLQYLPSQEEQTSLNSARLPKTSIIEDKLLVLMFPPARPHRHTCSNCVWSGHIRTGLSAGTFTHIRGIPKMCSPHCRCPHPMVKYTSPCMSSSPHTLTRCRPREKSHRSQHGLRPQVLFSSRLNLLPSTPPLHHPPPLHILVPPQDPQILRGSCHSKYQSPRSLLSTHLAVHTQH